VTACGAQFQSVWLGWLVGLEMTFDWAIFLSLMAGSKLFSFFSNWSCLTFFSTPDVSFAASTILLASSVSDGFSWRALVMMELNRFLFLPAFAIKSQSRLDFCDDLFNLGLRQACFPRACLFT
jgi:hypothetical protein